jgi:hypothetical protein
MPGSGRSGVQLQEQLTPQGVACMSQSSTRSEPKVVSVAVVAPGLGEFDYDGPLETPSGKSPELQRGDWLVVPFASRVLLAVVTNLRAVSCYPRIDSSATGLLCLHC